MPRPRVYVETTIPSAYFERRSTPREVARRECTRRWWEDSGSECELVTSIIVVRELIAGPPEYRQDWLSLIREVPLLRHQARVLEIVRSYISQKVMPGVPPDDAFHLAYASLNRCDYLLTWNCRHLANANKFGHIQRVNAKLGLFVPGIVTPQELLGEVP